MNYPIRIRDELEFNPAVVIVDVNHYFYSAFRPGTEATYLLHSVEFNIVPKRGLYTALELQEFMVRLFPDLSPTTQLNFRQDESCLWFGQLCFSEPPVVDHHDKDRVVADLSDRLFSSVYATPLMCGQMILNASLYHRRTLVRLFPSRKYVEDMLSEGAAGSYDRISLQELRRIKPLFRWFK